ncbi:helix-turn-helix transcriptional regulator [Arenibacterium sp. LLYu02]|uniref:helix-turn-helix transcriptional regulator n=1 Tax=Arenibacterium sp. LLYu02 TaxID=3404132 RepID=UPI003B22528E
MPKSRPTFLWSLFSLQILCTVFFMIDFGHDVVGTPGAPRWAGDFMEGAVAVALLLGTVFVGYELRLVRLREQRMRQQIDVASGAFADMLHTQFDAWGLTEAEREVALLGIKGYSIAEIASLRNTKEGTIKAQNAAVYRKAGVSGRLQLLAHFVEDLMGGPLIDRPAAAEANPSA